MPSFYLAWFLIVVSSVIAVSLWGIASFFTGTLAGWRVLLYCKSLIFEDVLVLINSLILWMFSLLRAYCGPLGLLTKEEGNPLSVLLLLSNLPPFRWHSNFSKSKRWIFLVDWLASVCWLLSSIWRKQLFASNDSSGFLIFKMLLLICSLSEEELLRSCYTWDLLMNPCAVTE